MGMSSKMHTSIELRELENALLNAISININDVNDYCKNNILPLYKKAIGEMWSKPVDNYNIIRKFFDDC